MIKGNTGAWKQEQWRAHALFGVAVASVVAIGVYPRLGSFLPACPIREHFRILCPGCGGTRAFIALLRGRIGEAIRLNALIVAVLPFGLWFAGESYWRAVRHARFEWPKVPEAAVYGLGAVAVLFAVLRNIV